MKHRHITPKDDFMSSTFRYELSTYSSKLSIDPWWPDVDDFISRLQVILSSLKFKEITIYLYEYRGRRYFTRSNLHKLLKSISQNVIKLSFLNLSHMPPLILDDITKFINKRDHITSLCLHGNADNISFVCSRIKRINIKELTVIARPSGRALDLGLLNVLKNLRLRTLHISAENYADAIFDPQMVYALRKSSLHTLGIHMNVYDIIRHVREFGNILANTNIRRIDIEHVNFECLRNAIFAHENIREIHVNDIMSKISLNDILAHKHIQRLEFKWIEPQNLMELRRGLRKNFTLLKSDSLCRQFPSYKRIIKRNNMLRVYHKFIVDLVLIFAFCKLDPYVIVEIFNKISRHYRHISQKIKVDIAVKTMISYDRIVRRR